MLQSVEAYAAVPKKWIHTVTGRKFYVDEPVFDIREIGHALSMQCRFTGHTPKFYSVAEHSVMVSRLCFEIADCQRTEDGLQDIADAAYEGLMHDAHEAYFSDLATPWKAMVPDYKSVENRLEAAMRKQFGLSSTISTGVKLADWYALFIEAAEFFPPGTTDDWPVPSDDFREKVVPIIASRYFAPRAMNPSDASRAFIARAMKFAMQATAHV